MGSGGAGGWDVDAAEVQDHVAVVGRRLRAAVASLEPGTAPHRHLDAALAELEQLRERLDGVGLDAHGDAADRSGLGHEREPVAMDVHVRAAELAAASQDHDAAVEHYQRSLRATEHLPGPMRARGRLEVLLALGLAQWRADRRAAADATFDRAAALARRLGDATGVARAALRGGIQYYFSGRRPADHARICREALAGLPAEDSALRARLLAELAAKLVAPGDADEGHRLATQALAVARRVGDPVAIGCALVAQQVTRLGPTTVERRRAGAEEILALAREARDPSLLVHGRFLLMGALLELGDVRGVDSALADEEQLFDAVGDPNLQRFSLWVRATRAVLQGRPAAAEALALESDELSAGFEDPDRIAVLGGQLGVIRWMQGRLLELEPLFEDQMRADPNDPLWPAVLAYVWSTHGRIDAASGALVSVGDLGTVPDGMHWLLTVVTAAEAAVRVGDTTVAASAREALLPFADRFVPIAMGASVWGTVARPLGLAALHLGLVDEGVAHLDRAVDVCARLGARPWLVEAQLDLAEALEHHGRGDDPRLPVLVTEAADTAAQLGLERFVPRAAQLRARHGRGEARLAPAPARRPSVSVLGAFEVRAVDRRPAEWTSRKARQLLKVLIARRGAPIHREELMGLLWPDVDPEVLRNRFSVALSAVRRALDPDRDAHDPIQADSSSVRLRLDLVDVDVERFLEAARSALDAHAGDAPDARAALVAALQLHRGPALPDEPYAEWALPLQREVRSAHLQVARALGDRATAAGDHLAASDAFHRLVEADPFDEHAHRLLLDALEHLGATRQAARERRRYDTLMGEDLLGSESGVLTDR